MGKDVIIACDFPSKEQTLAFLDSFGDEKPYCKIGMELFYSAGSDMVRMLRDRGISVFLDLKLHDIPNTVMRTMHVLASLGVSMCNVHACGTCAMMEAAMEGLASGCGTNARPKLIAVTQLTSTSEERMQRDLLISASLNETVLHYAENAKRSGLDGVVCSPLEAGLIHAHCGDTFCTVTPGIRFDSKQAADQVRITTPAQAKALGCDYIVVGRPITAAADPVAAYRRVVQEFVEA